ncbi:hypothetical protein EW145_g3911 [Phellinidium pouzarii]|uniref:Uncharacterized protein n=1 Tax=Phellinidium pouzarii TaxID=167371 RepID=A0A4S4L5P7_9AGAM|nr:hypothetical protein EW145_g3911 [Phellinidium pouzarii]
MGINVFSYLRQTLRRKDKARDAPDPRQHHPVDADWDFGARQTPDTSTHSVQVETPPPVPTPMPMPLAEAPGPRAGTRDPLPTSVGAIVRLEKRASVAVGLQNGMQDGADDEYSYSGSATCLAAGAFAKESRGIIGMDEMRRRVHSISAARLTDPANRPVLRHASSAFMTRDYPPSVDAHSPSWSTSSEIQLQPSAGSSDPPSVRRRTMIHAKRSMPQLHNIWENFLEETSKDSELYGPPCHPSRNPQPKNDAPKDSDRPRSQQPWRPDIPHPPLPQHIQTSSNDSVLTIHSVPSFEQSPDFASAELPRLSPSPKNAMRNNAIRRGHVRTSHQTSSSSASSHSGSASSMAFSLDSSSASSMTTMTTVYDCDNFGAKYDPFQVGDDNPTMTLNQHTDYIDYPHHRNEMLPSPASIDSHSSDGSQRTAPYSRSNTPLATPTATSPSHLQTPSTSRSSSRSPILVRAERQSPIPAHAHPRYQAAAAQGQWYSTSASPEELKLRLDTFPRVSAPQRCENFSLASADAKIDMSAEGDANSDEDFEDVLSELEFCSPRRPALPTSALAPTQSQPHPKVIFVPPPRRSSRQHLASLRSKYASSGNISLAAYDRARGMGNSGAPSANEPGRNDWSYHHDPSGPPSTVDTAVSPRSHSVQPAASQWARQARDTSSPCDWLRSQSSTPTFSPSPPVIRSLNVSGRSQSKCSSPSHSSAKSNAVQWGYAL